MERVGKSGRCFLIDRACIHPAIAPASRPKGSQKNPVSFAIACDWNTAVANKPTTKTAGATIMNTSNIRLTVRPLAGLSANAKAAKGMERPEAMTYTTPTAQAR